MRELAGALQRNEAGLAWAVQLKVSSVFSNDLTMGWMGASTKLKIKFYFTANVLFLAYLALICCHSCNAKNVADGTNFEKCLRGRGTFNLLLIFFKQSNYVDNTYYWKYYIDNYCGCSAFHGYCNYGNCICICTGPKHPITNWSSFSKCNGAKTN